MTGKNALDVVLVHGGFVDGAGWEGVYRIFRNLPRLKDRSSFRWRSRYLDP